MTLHAALAAMLEADRAQNRPALSSGSVSQARETIARSCAALGAGPEVGAVVDLAIATRAGQIAGRLFRPGGDEHGLVVYLHGGGWLAGTLQGSDALARNLAVRSRCALLLVDYRLAPEHPFPFGLEDTEDALHWAGANCAGLLGRRLPLVVAGDSAGANLATVAAISLRGKVELALQLLLYPVTDCDMQTESYRLHGAGLRLTREDMLWFFTHYAPSRHWADPYISPLRAADLTGSPPAWIATAEYDVLRDEGEAYARRLDAAGVPVIMRRYEGLVHGFARMMNVIDAANQALDDAATAISQYCRIHRPGTNIHESTTDR